MGDLERIRALREARRLLAALAVEDVPHGLVLPVRASEAEVVAAAWAKLCCVGDDVVDDAFGALLDPGSPAGLDEGEGPDVA